MKIVFDQVHKEMSLIPNKAEILVLLEILDDAIDARELNKNLNNIDLIRKMRTSLRSILER